MSGGLRLAAIANIGENLRQDYSSLTALVTSPPDINALVPYIKITDLDTDRVLYDNNKWLHNPEILPRMHYRSGWLPVLPGRDG